MASLAAEAAMSLLAASLGAAASVSRLSSDIVKTGQHRAGTCLCSILWAASCVSGRAVLAAGGTQPGLHSSRRV